MSEENGELQEKLQAGIQAAKSGNRAEARNLLEEVIAEDANTELAWIWLASAVTTLSERRSCLQKVLQINPDNQRAREALQKLDSGRRQTDGGSAQQIDQLRQLQRRQQRDDSAQREAELRQSVPSEGGRGGFPGGILLIGIVVLLIIIGGGLVGLSLVSQPTPTPTQVALNVTRATNTPRPTATIFLIELEEVTPLVTLQPTFTPTATFTPTTTFTPSPTPFPLSDFTVFYTSRARLSTVQTLYRIDGMGGNEDLVLANASDVSYDATGEWIVFVRDVTYSPDSQNPAEFMAPEIFLAPASDPELAEQITSSRIVGLHSPSLSPDRSRIVYVSAEDGDEELWLVDVELKRSSRLTSNNSIDRDPHWSPDGSQIVFASERNTPGSTEIYTLLLDGGITTQLTDSPGSSFAPRWSPDGTRITYVNDRSGDSDIFVMDADGQRGIVLTYDDGPAEDRTPDFTPDGRFVAFISNREDNRFQIYLVNFRGDELVRITHHDREVDSISFRPEARFISSN